MCIILVAILLVFNALLHILIVRIKLIHTMICAKLFVIIVNYSGQCGLFQVGFLLVILLLLRQIFLNLLDVTIALSWWREYAGNIQRLILTIVGHFLCLCFFEQMIIFNGFID